MVMTDNKTTVSIPAYRELEFLELVKKFNQKQLKYGLNVGTAVETNRFLKKMEFRTHIKGDYFSNDVVNKVNVEFITYELTDMSFIQKDDSAEYFHIGTMSMDWSTDIMQVYCADEQYKDYLKNYPNHCDHCNSNRKRNTYYVFLKDEKPFYLGSTCAKDIFGFESAEMLKLGTKLFYLIKDEYDDFDGCCETYIDFAQIVAFLNPLMAKKWQDIKPNVMDWAESDNKPYANNTDTLYQRVVNHYANPKNSFEQNASQVLKYTFCKMKNLMTYVCAVFFAMKDFYKQDNNCKTACISNFNIGDKVTVNNANVVMVKQFYNDYGYRGGYTYLIKMVAPNGEVFETYSSGAFANVSVGDTISFTGTVKDKGAFNGNEVWKMTRCKLA